MLLLVSRWLRGRRIIRRIIVLSDSSFAALELLATVRSSVTMITDCGWTRRCTGRHRNGHARPVAVHA